jgi:TM2 domain-containing membrane protein YozV
MAPPTAPTPAALPSSARPAAAPLTLDPLAAVLSYLIPGLGQVVQGRIGKGILFFVCLYGLFFYGLWLGQMKNVWLPNATQLPDVEAPLVGKLSGVPKALAYRPQFLGQFWIGVAAWPAILQYAASGPDLDDPGPPLPVLGRYMQTPTERELNNLQRDGNKRWDLGWVYTLIAGVLNVLVIYDALAGPAVRDEDHADDSKKPTAPPKEGGPA